MSYDRWMTEMLSVSLSERRATLLLGPRQSGKTTLVKHLLPNTKDYRTLDDLTLLAAAESDPHAFVKRTGLSMVIDEVQRVPELLLAIKKAIDESDAKGQYVLTGSANIRHLPTVKESLAGRVARLQLRPLAQGEILRKQPTFLKDAFAGHFVAPENHYDRETVLEFALRGGFPEPLSLDRVSASAWYKDYLNALLDYDLQEIINIRRRDSMQQLLYVLAAWSGQYMDAKAIQSSLSLTNQTFASYLNALEALFVFDRLPVYAKTDYARVGKRSKLYMNDSGMMASVLKWTKEKIYLDNEKLGQLLETLLYNELAVQVSCYPGSELYHYRDREKREIDFVIENAEGALLGIEVKAASAIKKDHFKYLAWFKEQLVKPGQSFIGIVLYTGEHVVSFGEGLWAVPMGCLWYSSLSSSA